MAPPSEDSSLLSRVLGGSSDERMESMETVVEELNKQTDAGCAVLGNAFLDTGMRQLLEANYPLIKSMKLCDERGLLQSSYSKCKLARALNLMTD